MAHVARKGGGVGLVIDRREFLTWTGLAAVAATGTSLIGASGARAASGRRVLVVGAGIAGLAAARELRNRGHEVLVIEGRDRIGGRIWTSHEWLTIPVDLGASWIHGMDGNPVTRIARDAGARLVTTSYDSSIAYDATGRPLDAVGERRVADMESRVAKALREAQRLERDQSVESAVRRGLGWSTLSRADRVHARFIMASTIEAEYSGSVSDTSAFWFDSVDEFPGEDALFPDGYSVVIEALAHGVPITTGETVRGVEVTGDGVAVDTDAHRYAGDQVVVTLPLGVLQSGAVRFSPELPARKRQAIDALGMGVLDKVFLRFPQVFWDPAKDWIEFIPNGPSEWDEWLSLARPTGRPVLLGFTAADFARRMEKLSDAQIVAGAMRTLRTMYGPQIPDPTGHQITRWAADPFSLGSYSFNALGSEPRMRNALAAPVGGRVFFAGEATERAYFGTVHGAYLSGVRVARQLSGLG